MSYQSQGLKSWHEIAAQAARARAHERRAELWRELERILDERRKLPPSKVRGETNKRKIA
jgi:predicted dithiol-disulfide oxidoreductase (DUF899 family)